MAPNPDHLHPPSLGLCSNSQTIHPRPNDLGWLTWGQWVGIYSSSVDGLGFAVSQTHHIRRVASTIMQAPMSHPCSGRSFGMKMYPPHIGQGKAPFLGNMWLGFNKVTDSCGLISGTYVWYCWRGLATVLLKFPDTDGATVCHTDEAAGRGALMTNKNIPSLSLSISLSLPLPPPSLLPSLSAVVAVQSLLSRIVSKTSLKQLAF